jgi:LysM repeat protein
MSAGLRMNRRFRPSAILATALGLAFALAFGQDPVRANPDDTDPPHRESAPSPRREAKGVYHVLREGQTLYSVSRAYGVPLETLAAVNGIEDPTRIPAGKALFVPGASRRLKITMPSPPRLVWPISGEITSGFETLGKRPRHQGIDIDGEMGQEIGAAAAGRVLWVGTERGYGKMVIIDHGRGLTTLYAHASKILTAVNQRVRPGDPVALVGKSGNARGPHLHFEVRRDGRPVNPLPLLKGEAALAQAAP